MPLTPEWPYAPIYMLLCARGLGAPAAPSHCLASSLNRVLLYWGGSGGGRAEGTYGEAAALVLAVRLRPRSQLLLQVEVLRQLGGCAGSAVRLHLHLGTLVEHGSQCAVGGAAVAGDETVLHDSATCT
jgi:hypothetical protein